MKLLNRLRSQAKPADHEQLQASLRQLDPLLDSVLNQFSQRLSVAEVLLYIPKPEYLVTVAVRPDTAPVLPTRVRADNKTILGNVLNTGVQFNGPVSNESGQPRTLETLRARVIPIMRNRSPLPHLLGVLNLESTDATELMEETPEELERILNEMSDILAKAPAEHLSSDRGQVDFLLNKVEKEMLYILDPNQLPEVYHQIRLAAAHLTSASQVVSSIVLRYREAYNLGLTDFEIEGDTGTHEWVIPVPNAGDVFNFPARWDLPREASITREVLESGKLVNIPDVTHESVVRRRKRVESALDEGSELNVPFGDSVGAFGTLILLSPARNAFSHEDEVIASRIARCLTVVTRRMETFRAPLRPLLRDQERVKQQIREHVDLLYTTNDFTRVTAIRDDVLKLIAHEAKSRTLAEVAAVVLAETASDGSVELVWNTNHHEKAADLVGPSEDEPFRLRTTEGLIGKAYSSHESLRVKDVLNPVNPELQGAYVQAFPRVKSELVVPLIGRTGEETKIWGVIDVESVQPDRFTYRHQQWVEFLATEAVNLLEALELATGRWFQISLEQLDRELATMRESRNVLEIQNQRTPLLQKLIDETRLLTGAARAQIYVAVNAYHDATINGADGSTRSAELNEKEGVLGAVITSPDADLTDDTLRKNIGITEGMAGQCVRDKKHAFFKDRKDRPKEYLSNIIDAKSALVVPIMDGQHVIAILNLESETPRWCGDMQIAIARYAANLAANIFVAYRLTLEMSQGEMLLHFAPQIELPDVKDYMEQVLLYAGKLTISPDVLRWGQIALVNDNTISYAVNCLFPDTFSYSEDDPSAQNVKTTLYTVFQRVCESGRPILIPNLQESSSSADSTDCPWPEAQSLLSVPLIQAYASNEGSESAMVQVTIGLLTIASSQAYHLNDSDRAVLHEFSHIITHGLLDIASLYSRVSLMRELRNEFRIFRNPRSSDLEDLRGAIRRIPDEADPDAAARAAAKEFYDIEEPVRLIGQLPQWYLLLSNHYPLKHPVAVDKFADTITFDTVVSSVMPYLERYVNKLLGSHVVWRWNHEYAESDLRHLHLAIRADEEEEQQMLKAAIFGCVSTATAAASKEGGRGYDICIMISKSSERMICMTVVYKGRTIPEKWLTFVPRYTQVDDLHTVDISERRLVEARNIARAFEGDIRVKPDDGGLFRAIELHIPHLS